MQENKGVRTRYPRLKALGGWIAKLGLVCLLLIAWGNYRWHLGFTAGADTTLCVIAHQVDGQSEAMRSDACQNIKGKKVPIFPDQLRPQGPPASGDQP